jgi:hypothetical protein
MPTPISLERRLRRKLPRAVKAARQWVRALVAGRRPHTRVVFVVGSQRSGTRLPLQALDCSPEIATFSEGVSPYFDRVLLQPLDRVERLLQRSPFPVVALKPICETHRVHELLDRFEGSKAIWIFRDYRDTVNSVSVKWRSGRDVLGRLANGVVTWRSGGLSREKINLVKRLYRDDMTLHEANAVMWYLRNGLFFDLNAHERPNILLVRYEDLVTDPYNGFARLFDFVDLPAPRDYGSLIRSSGVSKKPFPEISAEIRSLCEELQQRLMTYHGSTVSKVSPAVSPGTARAS